MQQFGRKLSRENNLPVQRNVDDDDDDETNQTQDTEPPTYSPTPSPTPSPTETPTIRTNQPTPEPTETKPKSTGQTTQGQKASGSLSVAPFVAIGAFAFLSVGVFVGRKYLGRQVASAAGAAAISGPGSSFDEDVLVEIDLAN